MPVLDPYNKALQKILRDKSEPPPTTATADELRAQLADVLASLRGHLSNVDRLDALEARERIKKQLARMENNG